MEMRLIIIAPQRTMATNHGAQQKVPTQATRYIITKVTSGETVETVGSGHELDSILVEV